MLAVWIQSFRSAFPGLSPRAALRLEELWQYTTELITELDRVADDLHPYYLDLLGLSFAIREGCREFTNKTGTPVECCCAEVGAENLDEQVVLAFFRVLQEALKNVAEHSQAKNVAVRLSQNSVELILQVSDDGVGFGETTTKAATGVGFIRMTERLRQIGGSLVVWSQPGGGTSIEVHAPLRGRERGVNDNRKLRLLL